MFSTLFTTTVVFALAVVGVRADFTVYTPTLTQCQPATLTWDPATGPYDVIVVPASDPCGDALLDLGDAVDGTSYQVSSVPLASGTQVMISVLDSAGQEGWSGTITVQPSDNDSCLNSQGTPNQGPNQGQGAPGQSSTTPSPTPTPPNQGPSHPSSSSSSSTSPAATVVGAANEGLIGAASMAQFSGVGIVFATLGALAVLL